MTTSEEDNDNNTNQSVIRKLIEDDKAVLRDWLEEISINKKVTNKEEEEKDYAVIVADWINDIANK
jgi:sulfate adenylyltransferase subunit 1 (EFTu-like GTPase family)